MTTANDDARARMRTAERLERGASAMSHGEQAAAHAAYGTTDLTPEQAYQLACAIPIGVQLPAGRLRHLYAVDSEGEPCTLLGIEAAGVWLIVWTYTAPHSPQVDLFVSEEDYYEHWDRAAALLKEKLATVAGERAEALAAYNHVERA